jgi:hypothetical protein
MTHHPVIRKRIAELPLCPQILVMIQEGLRVAVPLKDKTLGVVAVEVQLVLQSPVSLVRTNSAHFAARRLNSSSLPSWILSLATH